MSNTTSTYQGGSGEPTRPGQYSGAVRSAELGSWATALKRKKDSSLNSELQRAICYNQTFAADPDLCRRCHHLVTCFSFSQVGGYGGGGGGGEGNAQVAGTYPFTLCRPT